MNLKYQLLLALCDVTEFGGNGIKLATHACKGLDAARREFSQSVLCSKVLQ